jgi:antirestriction protein ArdC
MSKEGVRAMSNKVAEIVTENIVKMLDEGVVPWRRPWRVNGGDIAINAWGKPYRGINVFLLAVSKMSQGFQSNVWLTFNQVSKQGGKVREGAKGTMVVFWKVGQETITTDPDTGKVKKSRPFMLRYFSVFNLEQTHDVTLTGVQKRAEERRTAPVTTNLNPFDDAEVIIGTYLAQDDAPKFVNEGSDRAFYSPVFDHIVVPALSQYNDAGEYYSTVFHEFTHSTGHVNRLARKGVEGFDHFGSEQYAAEELVAEMGAAFLCAEAGIDNTLANSAAYIANWRQKLTDDPGLIVKAAGQAQKAADFIIGAGDSKEEEEES